MVETGRCALFRSLGGLREDQNQRAKDGQVTSSLTIRPQPLHNSRIPDGPFLHSGVEVEPQTLQQSGGVFGRRLRSPSS